MAKIILPKHIVDKATKYYKRSKSLNKTAVWIQKGCPVNGKPTEPKIACTRHPLTRILSEHGVPINPPNGCRDKRKGDTPERKVADPIKRLAAKSIYLAYCDIQEPDKEAPENFLSACFFIVYSELYVKMADYLDIHPDVYPPYVDIDKLRKGAKIYLDFVNDTDVPFHYRNGLWERMIEEGLVEDA